MNTQYNTPYQGLTVARLEALHTSTPENLRSAEPLQECGTSQPSGVAVHPITTPECCTAQAVELLRSELMKRCSRNSVRVYFAQLKAQARRWRMMGYDVPGYDYLLSVKIRKEASQHVYLSEEELKRLKAVKVLSNIEEYVKRSFLLGCYIGARHSDYQALVIGNMQGNMITYVSRKTGIEVKVPVSTYVRDTLHDGILELSVSDATYNTVLRRLCKRAGIIEVVTLYHRGKRKTQPKYKFVASHTARRSFCTNLYLRGLDLHLISKMAGHSSITMTEGYICCGLREIPECAKSFFE